MWLKMKCNTQTTAIVFVFTKLNTKVSKKIEILC